jgi:hypothetical protein
MRILRFLSLAAVMTCLFPGIAAAQGDRATNAAWFCSSVSDPTTVYLSAVWEKAEIQQLITTEFKKFIEARYGYKGSVACGGAYAGPNANAMAVEEKTKASQIAAWQKAGMKIVETGWTGNSPKVGPPAVRLSVCTGSTLAPGGHPVQGPFNMYVSAPFDSGVATIQEQQAAFDQFLRSKYALTGTDLRPTCMAVQDEAQAQDTLNRWTTRGSALGKVIDTGWKMGK